MLNRVRDAKLLRSADAGTSSANPGGEMHFYNFGGFCRRAEAFDNAQKRAKTIGQKLVAGATIFAPIALVIALRVAFSLHDLTARGKIVCVLTTFLAIEIMAAGAIALWEMMGWINDWVKPPDRDGQRQPSLLLKWIVWPSLALITIVGLSVLFVMLMQYHILPNK
jgi:hypothetical protein